MAMSSEAASQVLREAVRQTVSRYSIWFKIQSVLMVASGVLALAFPVTSSMALVNFLGWLLIVTGLIQALGLIGAGSVPQFWLQLVSVSLFLIVGAMFVRNSSGGLLAISMLVVVLLMIEGVSKISLALTIRPFPNWAWLALGGAVSVALSFYLAYRLPAASAWLLGALLGLGLITEGLALGYLSWRVRKPVPA
ncbi:MAG: HdeD family acid-resistance protein [Sphingomonas sp.]|uniref:HdeD family acid-resistance protein n=1 Tax=Sphingomonas sp. TaxID=28214 RepID=UPI002274B5FD|nr:HdeD family acid-resistance protein [Sphingomonas sp.]MCX8477160.1 HdeD family acid-resistance protein [Sphingomonas sp.]